MFPPIAGMEAVGGGIRDSLSVLFLFGCAAYFARFPQPGNKPGAMAVNWGYHCPKYCTTGNPQVYIFLCTVFYQYSVYLTFTCL